MNGKSLAVKNLLGRPLRTAALVALTALLSTAVVCGSVVVSSLRTGLSSLEDRLGADIMVVPSEASSKVTLEDIVLQGNTGYFYMPMERYEKIVSREGVGQVTTQFFLASASSGCCSLPVEIIGIDPETDFTVTPWIKKSVGELGFKDIVVGNDLNAFVGDTLKFYGVDCRVAAKLDRTGTSFDTSVFTSEETIRELIRSSVDLGMNDFQVDPSSVVSCVLINVADGYSTDQVMNDINIHVRKVKAVKTGDMIHQVTGSLGGVSRVISLLMGAVWVSGAVILLLVVTLSSNERRKEFAVLRVLGASRSRLAGIVMKEALLTGIAGSALGVLVGLGIVLPFGGLIESSLDLPYLTPGAGSIAGIALVSALVSVIAGMAAAAVSAVRVSRIDTGMILRGEN